MDPVPSLFPVGARIFHKDRRTGLIVGEPYGTNGRVWITVREDRTGQNVIWRSQNVDRVAVGAAVEAVAG